LKNIRTRVYRGVKAHETHAPGWLTSPLSFQEEDARWKVNLGVIARGATIGIQRGSARVPEISLKNFCIIQSPTLKLTGNDFPIGIRQATASARDLT
jgi:hypothetical protein